MISRKVALALLAFFGLAVVVTLMILTMRGAAPKPEEVHYHAGFRVYIDGQLQNYSAAKYMEIEPCTTSSHQEKEDDQAEKAHLHDGVGDVVHVHRNGAVWGDLFKNIKVSFDPGKQVVAYQEGGGVLPDIFNQSIKPYQSIVILVGDQANAKELVKNAVTLEHIKDVEARSETCGETSK